MKKKQNGKSNLYEQNKDEENKEENKVSNVEDIKKCKTKKEEILTNNIETVSSINNINKSLLTSSKEKVSSKKFDSAKTKLKKVNLDFNNSNHKNTSNSNTKKTIFTKLSEQMYNNILKNKDFQNIYDYESFTNESLLQKFNQVEKKSHEINEQNRKTIKDFIIRNEKKKTDKSKIVSPQTNKNKKIESNKKINLDEFLTKQNKFTEKKKQTIETMSKKIENEIYKNMREKPLINSKSNQIIYAKKNTSEKKKDIHSKLYEEYSEKKKHRTIQSDDIDESKEKKLPKKNNEIYKKLYENSKERSLSQRENERKLLNQVSKSFVVNRNSNEILAQKFLKKYESEITINFNKKADDNFNLNFSEFLLLLNKIGFIIKNYSSLNNYENNIEKEFQLSKEAWMIITGKNIFDDNENISSHKFLIFFLCVLGLYDLNIIKKNFFFIEKKNRFIEPKLIKEIPNTFRLFVNNEINSFLKKEKLNRSSISFIEIIENTYTFKPKINEKIYKSKSFVNHLNESHISVVTGYDEYRKEREKSIENKKRKILENELKECTFFPNNKIFHRSKSVSISVSERLYSKNNKNEKSKNKDSKENIIVNDFTPITTSFDSKIFNNDLIQTDSDVIKRCELLSKMRKEKKLTEFLLSKGYCPNKTEVNEKILREMNESCPKDFVFDNEIKNFKNTFSKFSKDKKRKKKLTKFVFEMNIDNQKKKLIIHQNDNIDLKVKQFCNENNLDFQSKSKIISAIKEKFSFIN